jgi:hypothetical protein
LRDTNPQQAVRNHVDEQDRETLQNLGRVDLTLPLEHNDAAQVFISEPGACAKLRPMPPRTPDKHCRGSHPKERQPSTPLLFQTILGNTTPAPVLPKLSVGRKTQATSQPLHRSHTGHRDTTAHTQSPQQTTHIASTRTVLFRIVAQCPVLSRIVAQCPAWSRIVLHCPALSHIVMNCPALPEPRGESAATCRVSGMHDDMCSESTLSCTVQIFKVCLGYEIWFAQGIGGKRGKSPS